MIEENGEENNYYGAKNSFHGLTIVPDCVDARHIRVVAYRDATEPAFGAEIGYAHLKDFDCSLGATDELEQPAF